MNARDRPAEPSSPVAGAVGGRVLPVAARTRWRVQGALVAVLLSVPVVGGLGAALWALSGPGLAAVVLLVPLVAAVLGVMWANRRHERFRYWLDAERLRVRDGVVVHTDAVAPLFRVQHVDLTRGPLQLSFGLATLMVHTASPAADVRLPDLRAEDAEVMRDEILTASRRAAEELGVGDVDAV